MGWSFFILKMKIIYGIILAFFLFLTPLFSAEPYALDKIVVKTQSQEGFESFNIEGIGEGDATFTYDVLNYVPGIDLRNRSPMGIQGDLSLNGSNFEEVAVAIDGINVMDPQTGHHNLDIPLTIFDVERINVDKIGDSSLYGAGAFAGSVNMVVKKPTQKKFNLEALFGEHALFGQALSLTFPSEVISGRFSFDHKKAQAAVPNTDFENQTASLYLTKDYEFADLDLLAGYQKKDFGADSFYSNLYPEEEEHTEIYFYKTGAKFKLNPGFFKTSLYLRKHNDKFILQRNNPTSVNYHTTYVYGFDSNFERPVKYGKALLGFNIVEEEINSTNLGKHSRRHEGATLGFSLDPAGRLRSNFNFGVDYYQKWNWQESFNLGLGYYLIDNKLKINGAVSRSYRLPSFTELYYSDPGNKGNPNLKEEYSYNFRLGLDFANEFLETGLAGFLRRGYNLIDWTRSVSTQPWQATNLGRVDYSGLEFNFKINPNADFKFLKVPKVGFSYNYMYANRKANGFQSKYALDILKHQYLLDIYTLVCGLKLNWQFSYNDRYYSDNYFVGNIYLGKKFETKDFSLEPFVSVDNFTNTQYSEVGGVLQPGRWIKTGLKFQW